MKHHISQHILDTRPAECDMCGGDNNGRTMNLDHNHKCLERVFILNKKTGNMIIDKQHPSKKACDKCFRGWLCTRCNRFILGNLTLEQVKMMYLYLITKR